MQLFIDLSASAKKDNIVPSHTDTIEKIIFTAVQRQKQTTISKF